MRIRDALRQVLLYWRKLRETAEHVEDTEVYATIKDFGAVVDRIEEGEFPPQNVERLDEDFAGRGHSFGNRVCQNCDLRYSCSSYRSWRLEGKKFRKDNVLEYFALAENREENEEYRYAAKSAEVEGEGQ